MPPLASRKQSRKMRFTHGTIHNLSPFSLQPMPPLQSLSCGRQCDV